MLGIALWDLLSNQFDCDPGSVDMPVSEVKQLIELSWDRMQQTMHLQVTTEEF